MVLAAAGLWAWTQKNVVPAEEAPTDLTLSEELTVSGLNFQPRSDSCVGYRFTPSISGNGFTYRITFTDTDGQSFPFDAAYSGGVCAGEAAFDHGYDSYDVTVSVSSDDAARNLAVASGLRFSENECRWTPLTE